MPEPVQHRLKEQREETSHEQRVEQVGDAANARHDHDGAGSAEREEEQAPPRRRQIESGAR
jgi:hypothetical protein